jgi:electron transfer flavoprotein alpha subunit
LAIDRLRRVEPGASLVDQVQTAVRVIIQRGGLDSSAPPETTAVPESPGGSAGVVAVIAEADRAELLRELLAEATRLATEIGGSTAVLTNDHAIDARTLGSYGADQIVHLVGATVEEDIAGAVAEWAFEHQPWAILAGSTAAGREVASRVAARLGAGLTGDAVELDVEDGRLVAWKPAFGGQLVAAVHTSSPIQLATVRSGVLPTPEPRQIHGGVERREVMPRDRVVVVKRRRDDDIDILADAPVVIGVGQGVDPADYPALQPLIDLLGAELGCTRKVTDQGWMTHARQIGIAGRAIAPRLFVMIGASGKFNHTVGIRAARSVLAINSDPDVPAWDHADAGIVADWRDVIPLLVAELTAAGA